MAKQTAVDFIKEELERLGLLDKGEVMTNIFKQAKQMEDEQEYETKCLWFGKGINAAITNRIDDLKPKRNEP